MMRSFPLTSVYIGSGLVIWATNFLVTYVFTALACARGFASTTIAGAGVVVWVTVIATAAGILVAACVAYKARRTYRARGAEVGPRDTDCSVHSTGARFAVLSMVAMAWTGFVAAVAFSCR